MAKRRPNYKKKKGRANLHPWRAKCPSRKYRFSSEAEAFMWARMDSLRYGGERGWYECHRCGGWHVFTDRSRSGAPQET